MALSELQRVRWEADGLLTLPGLLTGEELGRALEAANLAERAWRMDPHRSGRRGPTLDQIMGPIEYDGAFLDLLWHPKIFPIVRETLGSDVTMLNNDLLITPPRTPKTHSDWHHSVGMLGAYHPRSVLLVKVFVLLSDVDRTSGATAVIPGSHKFPADWRYPQVEDPKMMPGAVQMTGKAGDAYLFNGRVLHCAVNNESDNPRRLLQFDYGHLWMRVRPGYEPTERLLRDAEESGDPVRRQLLGLAAPYGGGILDD